MKKSINKATTAVVNGVLGSVHLNLELASKGTLCTHAKILTKLNGKSYEENKAERAAITQARIDRIELATMDSIKRSQDACNEGIARFKAWKAAKLSKRTKPAKETVHVKGETIVMTVEQYEEFIKSAEKVRVLADTISQVKPGTPSEAFG